MEREDAIDPDAPQGPSGRWDRDAADQALRLVRRASAGGPLQAEIEKEPSFGCCTVARLLGFNKNTVQRILQIKGWQVCQRAIGMRHRIEAVHPVATAPNESWSTDLCRVWAGRDGWTTLALVIDGHIRELLGWLLSRSGKVATAASTLEHALISRFGTLGKVTREALPISDSDLVFARRRYAALVRSYRLKQEFITPRCPPQNGMVERVIRALKEAAHPSQAFPQHPECQPRHRRLDQLLQPSSPTSGAAHENPR